MKNVRSEEVDWRIRVFDSLSFPTQILKPDRTIISVNQIFLKNIGLEMGQVIGKTCHEVFNRYFVDEGIQCNDTFCPLVTVLQDRNGHSVLRKVKGKTGEIRWEDRVFSPILDENGEVKYVIESVRDITQVKELERKYIDMQELMDKVVQSSASAIVAADRKGNIVLFNRAAEDLLGYRREEIEKVNVREIYPSGVAKQVMRKLRDASIGGVGKLPINPVRLVSKDGREIPVEMTAAILYENDSEAGTMGIFSDLRERLAVEAQLKEAKAQVVQSEKLASIGRLAAGVAHEINNPLTSIVMFGNMALEKLDRGHPLESHLRTILEDADRCREIVEHLLAYSRPASPSRDRFQLNNLVTEGLGLIRDRKLFLNITIEKQLDARPLTVFADKKQLCQVLINLIINAIDAMEGRGTLTFRTYPDTRTGFACLEIQDTGCGIPEAQIARVFDPFFTTKTPGKGTGLGLSTVYGIVKENKGRISVKKTGPQGTVFLLELPQGMERGVFLYDSIG